jgi:hypothetical protein
VPHITLQLSPDGPVVTIIIAVSQARRDALKASGQPMPTPQRIRGLIDTGASCSCVDASILQALNLQPTGTVPVHTPSTGPIPHPANQYDVSITLHHPPQLSFSIPNIPVVDSDLSIQGIDALIGRDILENALLVYDGSTGIFTMAF